MLAYIPIPQEIEVIVYLVAVLVPAVITAILGIAAYKHQQLEEIQRDLAGEDRVHKADKWDHTYTAAYVIGSLTATGLTLLVLTVWLPQIASMEATQYISAAFYVALIVAVINNLIARWSASGWLDEHVLRPILEERLQPIVEKTVEHVELSADKLVDLAEAIMGLAKKQ